MPRARPSITRSSGRSSKTRSGSNDKTTPLAGSEGIPIPDGFNGAREYYAETSRFILSTGRSVNSVMDLTLQRTFSGAATLSATRGGDRGRVVDEGHRRRLSAVGWYDNEFGFTKTLLTHVVEAAALQPKMHDRPGSQPVEET
jgi:hypothetical protein